MATIKEFQEKLATAFTIANKKILSRISADVVGNELQIVVRSKNQGLCNCINASIFSVKPDQKHKMLIEEVMVGYDSEGCHWSDHMGGTIVDCSGLNVQGAIEKIVAKMNELV